MAHSGILQTDWERKDAEDRSKTKNAQGLLHLVDTRATGVYEERLQDQWVTLSSCYWERGEGEGGHPDGGVGMGEGTNITNPTQIRGPHGFKVCDLWL